MLATAGAAGRMPPLKQGGRSCLPSSSSSLPSNIRRVVVAMSLVLWNEEPSWRAMDAADSLK